MKKLLTFILLLTCAQFLAAQNGVVITPNAGEPASQLSVTLTGINTQFSSGTFTMQFFDQGTSTNNIAASNFQITSPNTLQATLFIKGSATIGAYNYNLNHTVTGRANGLNPFYVGNPNNTPKVTNINPNIGGLNQTLTVSITGTRTRFTQGSQSVVFFQNGSPTSNIFINGISPKNDSLLEVDVFIPNNASRGFYDVAVGNFSNFFFNPESFEVTWASGLEGKKDISTALSVYPNPAKEELTIAINETLIEQIEVIDIQGRLVQKEVPNQPTNKITFNLDPFIVPNQYLILKIHTQKGVIFERVLAH
jgi:hypothetical protein